MSVLSDYCIGQLSRADANELIGYARSSQLGILEFGVGGSTLIWAQFAETRMMSSHCVDDDPVWIEKTSSKIRGGLQRHVMFIPYVDLSTHECWTERLAKNAWYDLIFIDGKNELRSTFALDAWRFLAPTGKMIFHDSRLEFAQNAVLGVMKAKFMEISSVESHRNGSNLSVITKCVDVVRVRDDIAEGREPWETGFTDPPKDWGKVRR